MFLLRDYVAKCSYVVLNVRTQETNAGKYKVLPEEISDDKTFGISIEKFFCHFATDIYFFLKLTRIFRRTARKNTQNYWFSTNYSYKLYICSSLYSSAFVLSVCPLAMECITFDAKWILLSTFQKRQSYRQNSSNYSMYKCICSTITLQKNHSECQTN